MKRLTYILVLGLALMAPCVRSAQADPITYWYSAGYHWGECSGCGEWEYAHERLWEPWWPVVSGTFTLDAGVLVEVDGHPPGWWPADGGQELTEVFGTSIHHVFEVGWDREYEYWLTFRRVASGSSSSPLVGGRLVHHYPYIEGIFVGGEISPAFVPEPVPEPASLLLLGTGLVGLRAWRKRR